MRATPGYSCRADPGRLAMNEARGGGRRRRQLAMIDIVHFGDQIRFGGFRSRVLGLLNNSTGAGRDDILHYASRYLTGV